MAKEDTPKYVKGFRFHPFDRELITDYLKPKIMGIPLPCNMIKFKKVYGPSSNAWRVFDTNDCDSWFRTPGLKKTEKCMFVFVELCKLSRLNSSTSKNTSKRAGCGTWLAKGKQDSIVDCEGNVIGEKRYLVFEINNLDSVEAGFDLSRVGQFKMHEYSLSGVNAGLNSANSIVLCRITYDSSKQCPLNLKPGARTAIVVSSISEAQNKEEENTNNFKGSGIVETEKLTLLDNCVSVGENLEESRTLTSKDLAVIDSVVAGNLEGSRSAGFYIRKLVENCELSKSAGLYQFPRVPCAAASAYDADPDPLLLVRRLVRNPCVHHPPFHLFVEAWIWETAHTYRHSSRASAKCKASTRNIIVHAESLAADASFCSIEFLLLIEDDLF
ncbi:hypothetical protein POM88_042528 [Heracleum sosnowskyi]|uniref:NAC domain-containing protein n=1 Tax=Heracleum sosnowskyi TaxID=360622 RepID=A0AAD8HGE8_9APIA|nr:hypothetical protein POM88_042528 [Heracleum sosnowskyi]